MARGVDTVGDAMEDEPLDRLTNSLVSSAEASVELRLDDGKTTAVEMLSVVIGGIDVGAADVADSIMVAGSAWR